MSIPLVINGTTYDYPEVDDIDWGPDATDWAAAVTVGMLQKAGGLFQLLAELDFGTAYGIKSLYYKTRTTSPADAGQFRLARADVISWRNQAGDGNLDLSVNSSNALLFNGTTIQTVLSVSDTATIDLTLSSNTLSADIKALSITDSMISASAAIAFSKLATLTSGNILVGSAGNVATSVAMAGDATITNAGVVAIGSNKVTNAMLAQVATPSFKGRISASTGNVEDLTVTQATSMLNNFVGDSGLGGTKGLVPAPASGDAAASKFLGAGGTWSVPSGAGDVSGPASSTDNGFVRFNGVTGKVIKDSAATITNTDIIAAAAIAVNKLAAVSASKVLVSDASGFLSASSVTTTTLGYLDAMSSIQTQLDGKTAKATLAAKGSIYGASAASTPAELTVGANGTILTAASGETTGLKWLPPGGIVLASSTTPLNLTTETQVLYTSSGTSTINLPAGSTGRQINITKVSSDLNVITVDGDGSEQIQEAASAATTTTINTPGESILLIWNGSLWEVANRRIPSTPIAYTPSANNLGFGTIGTVEILSYRNGSFLFIDGNFTTGTATGSEARLSLGFNGSDNNVTSTAISSIRICGTWTYSATATSHGGLLMIEASKGYLVFGGASTFGNGNINPMTKATGTGDFGSSVKVSIQAKIPISGWKG